MRPSPPQDAFPSTPSSACSGMYSRSPSSADHELFSPPTPYECFSPEPAIVDPDDFTFHIDVQLDRMVGSPHNASITHLLPQSVVPSPITDSCLLSGDETTKMQVYMRNKGRWGRVYDPFESSPSPHLRVFDDATDDFSWEVAHSPLLVPDQLPEPSRCSLLIHEVSLLVGLTQDDTHPSPDDHCPLVPDPPIQVHDTLPLNITPTKSLASGKLKNAGTNSLHLPNHYPCIPDMANQSFNNHAPPLAGSRDPTVPIPRYKNTAAPCPSLSPRRRQGQVFHIDPPYLRPVDLDETFCHPRQPPPKPPPNRSSSLNKLEYSLRKLEAHAPRNHRKSRSEGRPSDHVSEYKVSRPSLPPPPRPPRLKQRRSSYEKSQHTSPRTARPRHLSGPPPVPRPIPPHHHVTPPVCPAVPPDDGCFEEDPTPGSFMDMDIPLAGDPHRKRQISLRQVNGKEKMKGLVGVAKRVSRGVIAWGKNLTTKPPQKTAG